jgi:hypothetical protein
MKTKCVLAMMLFVALGSVTYAVDVDGTLAPGEYSKEAVFDNGNFRLLWKIEGDKAFMAIDAKTPGWVAIGFQPTFGMANADIIFGIVDASGKVQAIDAWSTGIFGPHPPDVSQGGHDNILASAGKRTADRVVFEFSRLLNTGDKLDRIIPAAGSFKIIWSYGSDLQFNNKHITKGAATLTMDGSK